MKWKNTQLASVFFMILISNFCYSQTDTILRKDFNGYIYSRYNLSSFKRPEIYSIPSLNLSLNHSKPKSRYSLYDSPKEGMVLYDNYRHEYLPNYLNVYDPYDYSRNNMKDALINGSLEYLLQLFDK